MFTNRCTGRSSRLSSRISISEQDVKRFDPIAARWPRVGNTAALPPIDWRAGSGGAHPNPNPLPFPFHFCFMFVNNINNHCWIFALIISVAFREPITKCVPPRIRQYKRPRGHRSRAKTDFAMRRSPSPKLRTTRDAVNRRGELPNNEDYGKM